jgi:hypothetical protein
MSEDLVLQSAIAIERTSMAAFTIRVELFNATREQYAKLAQDLATKGIVDVIVADGGIRYKLPPAEYNFEGNATNEQVIEAVKASAAKVVAKYAVLVTNANSRLWNGLDRA